MFSTSAPFFNPGSSEEGSGSNSSNSGSPANPDGSAPAPISAMGESLKEKYYEKKAERSRVGEEYKKLNDIDSFDTFEWDLYFNSIGYNSSMPPVDTPIDWMDLFSSFFDLF